MNTKEKERRIVKALYQEFLHKMDTDDMIRKTTELMHIEMGQTYRDYARVVRRVRDLMTEAGIPQTEILEFPADGRTSFLDAVSPLAWDASVGRLTLLPSGEVAERAENGQQTGQRSHFDAETPLPAAFAGTVHDHTSISAA